MEEFEIARNITLGQYLALDSVVHRLDPRIKLLCFSLLVAAITFSTGYVAQAVLMVVTFALIAVSRIPIRFALSGLKPAIPFLIVITGMQMVFYTTALTGQNNCVIFFSWGPVQSNSCGVQAAVISTARFIDLLILASLLTFSTTITELTLGTERLLSPLQRRFNFPAHELALTMTIALRFVPTFAEELERIMKAQASRGADFGQGKRFAYIEQTRALVPLVVPLFLSALRRAEDLILAMEARCYVGGRGRTHLSEFHTTRTDWVALALVTAFVVIVYFYPFPF